MLKKVCIMLVFNALKKPAFDSRKESGIGAGIDSYYEYLLKSYIFLGDETYLERFNTHYQVGNFASSFLVAAAALI